MNSTSDPGWKLRILAASWKHFLRVGLLLGAIGGLSLHLSKFRHLSVGVIQLRTPSAFSPEADPIRAALCSRDFIEGLVSTLGLSDRWKLSQEACVSRFRKMIRYRAIRGTALKEVSVKGGDMEESTLICRTVLQAIRERFSKKSSDSLSHELLTAKAFIVLHEMSLSRKMEEIAGMGYFDTLRQNNRIALEKAEFDETSRKLETLKFRELELESELKMHEDPILMHEWPSASLPESFQKFRTRSLLMHLTFGSAAGAILSFASLAFLRRVIRDSPPAQA